MAHRTRAIAIESDLRRNHGQRTRLALRADHGYTSSCKVTKETGSSGKNKKKQIRGWVNNNRKAVPFSTEIVQTTDYREYILRKSQYLHLQYQIHFPFYELRRQLRFLSCPRQIKSLAETAGPMGSITGRNSVSILAGAPGNSPGSRPRRQSQPAQPWSPDAP
jgi:hypothetical protein